MMVAMVTLHMRLLALLLFALALSPHALAAQTGGVETLTGEMLFAGGNRISFHQFHREGSGQQSGSQTLADPLGHRFQEDRSTLGFDHGLSSRFTLTALLPYVSKSHRVAGVTSAAEGVGDVALLVKWLPAFRYWQRGGWHLAVALGSELPTGATGERDHGAFLAPSLQPGSGSWDPFVSLAANLELDRWRFDLIGLYKDNGLGTQDWHQGDSLALDLLAAYRFLHRQYPGPSANAKLGLLYRNQGQASLAGLALPNSGSETWLGSFRLSWHPQPQWDLGLSVAVPLAATYDGTQTPMDFQVSLTAGLRF